jgi:integrase
MNEPVKQSYRLYRRENGVYYLQNNQTGKQESLGTRDDGEAQRLQNAKNESVRIPQATKAVGIAYLSAADPDAPTRKWSWVFDQILLSKTEGSENRRRWEIAVKDHAFDGIRNMVVIDTRADHFLSALNRGTVSTNVYLRKIHNFTMDMGWLAGPVIVRRQWPSIKFKKKRAITEAEHQKIIANEVNPERRDFYEMLWYTGASQGDMAHLDAEEIDPEEKKIRFFRAKTGSVVCFQFSPEVEEILRRRPQTGKVFPYLAEVRACDRATEFMSRCKQLGIKGVTLHCYRHGWAHRARKAGFPMRFAQLALGHNSPAVHQAYAGYDEVEIPCLQDYEAARAKSKIVPMPAATNVPAEPGQAATA